MEGWGLAFLKESFRKVTWPPPCVSSIPICLDFVLNNAYTPLSVTSAQFRFNFLNDAYTLLLSNLDDAYARGAGQV